mmetsp:Transcript_13473/g.20256  ORF Transcript_13473/g.20256 Transcript_13473/m.20256 type:complete len:116 (+) Transcript_13473:100-447(+)
MLSTPPHERMQFSSGNYYTKMHGNVSMYILMYTHQEPFIILALGLVLRHTLWFVEPNDHHTDIITRSSTHSLIGHEPAHILSPTDLVVKELFLGHGLYLRASRIEPLGRIINTIL